MDTGLILPSNMAVHISGAVAHGVGIDTGVYMVVYQHRPSDSILVVPIGEPKPLLRKDGRSRRQEPAAKPIILPLSLMEKHREAGRVTPVSIVRYDWMTSPNHGRSENDEKYLKKWHPILLAMTGNLELEQMFIYGRYAEMIRALAKTHQVSESSLKKKLVRYFISGGSIEAACLTNFRLPRVKDHRVTMKLGRPANKFDARGNPNDEGQNATPDAIAAVGAFYLIRTAAIAKEEAGTSTKTKVSDHYREYCKKFVDKVVQVDRSGEEEVDTDPLFALSERQFRYYWAKEQSAMEAAKLKAGLKIWFKDFRVITSHARVNDLFPGSTYIIDSTVGDVYLVSDQGRKRLVGRPVIYVVVDTFSYLILAVHVCLQAPSSEQAKVALYQALTAKDRIGAALGLKPLVQKGLIAGIRPQAVLSDRGSDLLSKNIRLATSESNVIHSVAAAYRADWKAIVERYFRLMNDAAIHHVPGATKGRNRERGETDCRLDAKLTLSDLKRLLLALAARWNLTHDCSRKVPWSLSACPEQIQPTPLGLYQAGLKWLHGSGKPLSREEAVRTFLTPLIGHANRNGITAKTVRYVAPWMVESEWFFDLARQESVPIYRDPDRQDRCFLFGERDELLEAQIVDEKGELPSHLFYDDYVDGIAHAKYDADDFHQQNAKTARRLEHIQDTGVKEAIEQSTQAQADDNRSKAAKLRGMRGNREDEVC